MVSVMVLNANFNNISFILKLWRSVLLVEEIGVTWKITGLPQITDKLLSQNVVWSKPCHKRGSNSQWSENVSCEFYYWYTLNMITLKTINYFLFSYSRQNKYPPINWIFKIAKFLHCRYKVLHCITFSEVSKLR